RLVFGGAVAAHCGRASRGVPFAGRPEPQSSEAVVVQPPFTSVGPRVSSVGSAVLDQRLVNFPLRVLLALVVIGAFAGVGVWGIVAGTRAKSMTESQRMMAVGGIVVLMATLAAWVIFFWPVYWDWSRLFPLRPARAPASGGGPGHAT